MYRKSKSKISNNSWEYYNVLDTVIEPDGEYIIKCDDGRRLVAPRSLFKDV